MNQKNQATPIMRTNNQEDKKQLHILTILANIIYSIIELSLSLMIFVM